MDADEAVRTTRQEPIRIPASTRSLARSAGVFYLGLAVCSGFAFFVNSRIFESDAAGAAVELTFITWLLAKGVHHDPTRRSDPTESSTRGRARSMRVWRFLNGPEQHELDLHVDRVSGRMALPMDDHRLSKDTDGSVTPEVPRSNTGLDTVNASRQASGSIQPSPRNTDDRR